MLSGDADVEYFAPLTFRLEPDLLVTVLGALVYAGDIVLAITGDKIDSGKLTLLAERQLGELTQFKHIEAPKEINVAVLRSLFEMLDLPPGLAPQATQGSDEPVRRLQDAVSTLTRRVLDATTDMQERLSFWGQPLLRNEELADWRAKLERLRSFSESLARYNTVGKLKNLHIGSDDIATHKKQQDVLLAVERMLELVAELGSTASYLSQAEMVLSPDHDWVTQAQDTRKQILHKLASDRIARHAREYRQSLRKLKNDYIFAYAEQHSRGRLGVAEARTKSALQKDPRIKAMRALAGICLLPTSQLTSFEEKLDKLKTCISLLDSELAATPVCPHCDFRPANTQGAMFPVTNVLKQLDDELDRLLENWVQTLVENLGDPIIQSNLDLLKDSSRTIVGGFAHTKTLPETISPEFIAAVQEALSDLEKITVTSEDIKQALLKAGSPATPQDLRKRFETFLNDRCKGKDTTKVRFVVE